MTLRTTPRIAVVGIVLSFSLAVAVGILRTVNAEPVERAAEVAGNISFAVSGIVRRDVQMNDGPSQ